MAEKEEIDYRKMYDDSWSRELKNGRENFGDLELAKIFLEQSSLLKKEHSILEIGCGIGKLCDYLHSKGFHSIFGTDISQSAIDFGKNKYPHLNLSPMDGNNLDFKDGTFDTCVSFDLVEHLPDISSHFKEVSRILKPQGIYFFQTPNIISNSIRETIIRKGFEWKIYHPSLQFSWTLKKKVIQNGFSKVEFVKIPPLSDYKLKQLPKWLRSLFLIIPWSKLPLFLQTNFYVIAYK